MPACPHQAIHASGEIGRALTVAARGDGILILSPEATAHFYPATPEQVVNACYAAGFRTVHRGVIGDELVAAEYLSLWRDEGWGTLIRSTDPVVVETVRIDYPELVPYLAPVTIPAVAEARYLRAQHGQELRIVYAGVAAPRNTPELDAAVTFEDLERIFQLRGVSVLAQADFFARIPEERRRHLSAAGGLPLAMLEEARHASRRFRTIRGLEHLPALAQAVAVDRLDLGFVDLLSFEGGLDHPLSGRRTSSTGGARSWRARSRRGAGAGGGRSGGGEHRGHVRDPAAAAGVRPDGGGGGARGDRAGAERAPLGLRGLRLRHLRAVRVGGGARAGRRCGSARRTRSAGRTRRRARRRWTC